MGDPQPVAAAGAVVWRDGADDLEVVLVHRPKYDDWSFPKGKLDPGEQMPAAATREVAEETGLQVALGARVADSSYPVAGGRKCVRYWSARPVHGTDVSGYRPNPEVDDVRWLPTAAARRTLSHRRDVEVLDIFAVSPFRTRPLLVLRHGAAVPRDAWQGTEQSRPLTRPGRRQAEELVPLLAAYGVSRVVTSDAQRCVATVQPFARAAPLELEPDPAFSEQATDPVRIRHVLQALLDAPEPTLVCSHRQVLPEIFTILGSADPGLDPGDLVVVHHLGTDPVSVEHHPAALTGR